MKIQLLNIIKNWNKRSVDSFYCLAQTWINYNLLYLHKWLRLQSIPYDTCSRMIPLYWCSLRQHDSCVYQMHTRRCLNKKKWLRAVSEKFLKTSDLRTYDLKSSWPCRAILRYVKSVPHKVVASLCSSHGVQKPVTIYQYKMRGNRNVQTLHCFPRNLDNKKHELTAPNLLFLGKKRLQSQ